MVYKLTAAGRFPQPISLSVGRKAWIESEVDQWLEERKAERDSALAEG
jgi:prophage regulatory protein